MLPTKFQANWPLVHEKKRKIDFQDGRHLGYPTGMILAILDLQVTPMLPTKFQVNWPFGSGEEAKNRFSRWWPSWINFRSEHFYPFFIYRTPQCFLLSLKSIGLSVQEKKRKIDFQDGRHLGFPTGLIWLLLIYKSPPCCLPSFKSVGLLVQEKKRKIDFQDGSHLEFLIGMILAIFDLQVTPMLPTKFQVTWPSDSGKKRKIDFQDGHHSGHLGFPNGMSFFSIFK